MKAYITKDGILKITAETGVEEFALKQWGNVAKVIRISQTKDGGSVGEAFFKGSQMLLQPQQVNAVEK